MTVRAHDAEAFAPLRDIYTAPAAQPNPLARAAVGRPGVDVVVLPKGNGPRAVSRLCDGAFSRHKLRRLWHAWKRNAYVPAPVRTRPIPARASGRAKRLFRLAKILKGIQHREGHRGPILLPKREIAAYLGCSPSTVQRTLEELRELGMIDLVGCVQIGEHYYKPAHLYVLAVPIRRLRLRVRRRRRRSSIRRRPLPSPVLTILVTG